MSDTKEENGFKPPQRTFTVELWVGIFTMIGVACFGYLAVNLAGMKFFNTGYYDVTAQFDNVAGLKPGAPVEIAGVPIGEVAKISLASTFALVTLRIREGVNLRDDDIAQIRTKGIIGDRYVKISPGSSKDYVGVEGQILDTESAVELEEILGKFIHRMDA